MKRKLMIALVALCSTFAATGLASCELDSWQPVNPDNQGRYEITLDSTQFDPVVAYNSTIPYEDLVIVYKMDTPMGGKYETKIIVTADMVTSGVDTTTVGEKKLIVEHSGEKFTVPYTVKYQVDFVTKAQTFTQFVLDGSEVVEPEVPETEGFTFAYWKSKVPEVIEDNVRIEAHYYDHALQAPALTTLDCTYAPSATLATLSRKLPSNEYGHWEFIDETQLVGEVGTREFDVRFVAATDEIAPVADGKITVKVEPKELVFSVKEGNFVYNKQAQFPAYSLFTDVKVIESIEHPTDAGTYEYTLTVDDPNYVGSYTGKFTIEPRTVQFVVDSVSFTYDGKTAFYPTYTFADAEFIPTEVVRISGKEEMNAGSYAYGWLVTDGNYEGMATGTYTVEKPDVTVTAIDAEITYPESIPEITYTVEGFADSELLDITIPTPAQASAGTYTLTPVVGNPNVNATCVSATLTVHKGTPTYYEPTLSTDSTAAIYHDPITTVTFSNEGFGSWAWKNPEKTLDDMTGIKAVAVFTPHDPNLVTIEQPFAITNIDKRAVKIVVTQDTYTYTGGELSLQYKFEDVALPDSYTVDADKITLLGNKPEVNANSYERKLEVESECYRGAVVSATLTVQKATPVISGLNTSYEKVYDGEAFVLSGVTHTNTDGEELQYASIVDAGDYRVTLTLPESENFVQVSTSFALKVNKATPTISGLNASYEKDYDGTPFVLNGVTGNNPETQLAYDQVTEGGVHTVKVWLAETSNYNYVEKTTSVTIHAIDNGFADANYQPAMADWTYGNAAPVLDIAALKARLKSQTGYDANLTPVVTYTHESGAVYTDAIPLDAPAGVYTVVISVPGNRNWNAFETDGFTATMEKKSIEIPALTVNGEVYVEPFSYDGGEKNSTLAASEYYDFTNVGGSNVGEYVVTLTLNNANYKWSDGSETLARTLSFEIEQATDISLTDPTIVGWTYLDTPNAPTATAAAFVPTDKILYRYSAEMSATTPVGTYQVQAYVEETTNYVGATSEWVSFTVSPKVVGGADIAALNGADKQTAEYTYNNEYQLPVTAGDYEGYTVTIVAEDSEDASAIGKNAGEYLVTLTAKDNYALADGYKTNGYLFEIARAKVTAAIRDNAQERYTYDGTEKTVEIVLTVDGVETQVSYDRSGDSLTQKNAGNYTLSVTLTDSNYELAAGATLTFTIYKATMDPVTFTADTIEWHKGLKLRDILLPADSGYKWKDAAAELELRPEATAQTFAEYAIYEKENYEPVSATVIVTVEKAKVTLTVTEKGNAVYTGNAYTVTDLATVTDDHADFDETCYTLWWQCGEQTPVTTVTDAGDYTVVYQLKDGVAEYYEITYTPVTVTIEKAEAPRVTVETEVGQMLKDMQIPTSEFGTWAWDYTKVTAETFFEEKGTQFVDAIFTPNATYNHNYKEYAAKLQVTVGQKTVATSVTVGEEGYEGKYTGKDIQIAISVVGYETLTAGEDYTYAVKYNGAAFATQNTAAFTVKNAGTYTITLTLSTDNYSWNVQDGDVEGATLTVKVVIGKATNAITDFVLENWTYGEEANEPSARATFGTVKYSYSTEENGTYTDEVPQDAGTYWVKATVAADGDNYDETSKTISFVIEQATPEVTLTLAYEKVWTEGLTLGDITPTGSASTGVYEWVNANGEKVATDTALDALVYNAWYVRYTPSDDNYKAVSGLATITVTPKLITAPTVTVTELVYAEGTVQKANVTDSKDSAYYTLVNEGGEDAGSYVATVKPISANYAWKAYEVWTDADKNGELEYNYAIQAALVEIRAEQTSFEYTGNPVVVDLSVWTKDGKKQLAETLYTVSGNGTQSGVGTWYITVALNTTNYAFEEGGNVLEYTITKAPNDWETEPSIEDWTFGDKSKTLTWSTADLRFTTNASVKVTYYKKSGENYSKLDWTEIPEEVGAGEYKAEFTVAADAAGNWLGFTSSVTFTVTPKEVSPLIEGTEDLVYSGNKHAIRVSGEACKATLTGERTGKISLGEDGYCHIVEADSYTATLELDGSGNYVWANYEGWTLTGNTLSRTFDVAPKKVTPSLDKTELTYNGNAQTVTATVDVERAAFTIDCENENAKVEEKTISVKSAGTYEVVFTLDDANNYAWEGENTLTITVAPATDNAFNPFKVNGTEVEGDSHPVTYSGSAYEATATAKYGMVNVEYAEEGSSIYSKTAPVNAGKYTVKLTVAVNDNYNGLEKTITLSIAKKKITPSNVEVTYTGDGAANTKDGTGGTKYYYENLMTPKLREIISYNVTGVNGELAVKPDFAMDADAALSGATEKDGVMLGTKTITITFTLTNDADKVNYEIVYPNAADESPLNYYAQAVTLKGVAYIGSTYYGTIENAVDYANNNGGGTVWVVPDTTYNVVIEKQLTINSDVTLVLPYADAQAKEEARINQATSGVYEAVYLNVSGKQGTLQLITRVVMEAGSSLEVNGKLQIAGELNGGGNSEKYAGNTGGKYAELVMKEKSQIIVNNGGTVQCFGFILEESLNNQSKITVNNGGIFAMPFVVRDFRGGSFMYGSFGSDGSKGGTPFNQFEMRNVTAALRINYGAQLLGYANLATVSSSNNPQNATTISLIGTTSSYLIQLLTVNSYVTAKYNTTIQNYTVTTDGAYCELHIYGGAMTNKMTLNISIGSADTSKVYFPLTWRYQITLHDGAYTMGQKFKMMPGSQLTVKEDASLAIGELSVYDASFTDPYGSLKYDTGKGEAVLTVNGSLTATVLGGKVYTNSSGATITVTTATVTTKETVSISGSSIFASAAFTEITKVLELPKFDNADANYNNAGTYYSVARNDNKTFGWYPANITITYETSGGDAITPATWSTQPNGVGHIIVDGDLPTPTKTGTEFLGWYLDSSFTQPVEIGVTTLYDHTTLYAKWSITTYSVTFVGSDGTTLGIINGIEEGQNISSSGKALPNLSQWNNNMGHQYYYEIDQAWLTNIINEPTTVTITAQPKYKLTIKTAQGSKSPDGKNPGKIPTYTIYLSNNGTDEVASETDNTGIVNSTGTIYHVAKGQYVKLSITNGNGNPYSSYTAITGDTSQTITGAQGTNSGCVTPETLITLADGSQVMAKDLTGDELLLTWNHATGKFEATKIAYIVNHDSIDTEHLVTTLYFEDGKQVEIIAEHVFFDTTLGRYVTLTAENVEEYIGHSFSMLENDGLSITKLVKAESEVRMTRAYEVVTYQTLTCFTNGVLSCSGYIEVLLNMFEINSETMCYDSERIAEDIATYGLYTYEDFADLVPEEVYEMYNAKYLKIAVGKGLITWEGIEALIDFYYSLGIQPM